MSKENVQPIDIQEYLWRPVLALAINALVIGGLWFAQGPMFAAKVLFIEIALIFGLICLGVAFFHRLILNLLEEMAIFAEDRRQEAVLEMRHGREQLMHIRERMENAIHPPPAERPMEDLLHHALPIIQGLLSKEKNWIQLGMFGWRIAQDAMRLFKQR
jgi:hypothetical protein